MNDEIIRRARSGFTLAGAGEWRNVESDSAHRIRLHHISQQNCRDRELVRAGERQIDGKIVQALRWIEPVVNTESPVASAAGVPIGVDQQRAWDACELDRPTVWGPTVIFRMPRANQQGVGTSDGQWHSRIVDLRPRGAF